MNTSFQAAATPEDRAWLTRVREVNLPDLSTNIMKQAATDQLINALRTVLRGQVYLSDAMQPRLVERSDPAATPRSRLSAREIANSLSLSVKTIESHRATIKRKLGLATNAQLVQYAILWHGRTDV